MSQTLTISDSLYTQLHQFARRRGLQNIEQLLEQWLASEEKEPHPAVVRAVREQAGPIYRQTPASLALIDTDDEQARRRIEPTENPFVVRTERGLTVAGTRITLYLLMDYLKADWPPKLIQHWHDLTDEQIEGVMVYIDAHRADVEAEYQLVLKQAEENRAYWEERNRERFEEIKKLPPKPGYEKLYAKLKARKAELGME
ncbi:MAG: hypothetical protein DCC55_00715 [Chloroflexi bacterium]|nr:MAG: hypothetical protein DCC55_00715 [Chloroflexota bacterium]